MSLACLMCQSRTDSDLRSYSFDEKRWTSSSIHNSNHSNEERNKKRQENVRGSVHGCSEVDASPRLVRCHAVRRDIFRDFRVEDVCSALTPASPSSSAPFLG
eukprot:TRINITY_DN2123_c0_g1_i1.p1 TRINITY_DN2123_c0_g1~~TRINITY_DN2123_c0_g1_i1.p1  ORF type:complete len:102 (+),score=22.47 TRINITY_DN2123_c0_g1_i1:183-488(+)